MRCWLIILVLATSTAAFAQTPEIDLGPGVSTLVRYRVYPHLQRGLLAVSRGDETTAIAELEQARRLAPENPVVALHLVDAYRRFGRNDAARSLLQDQLKNTPRDARLSEALSALPPLAAEPPLTADALATTSPARAVEAATLDGNSAVTQAALGFAAWNAGDSVKAERAFERAWKLNPNSLVVTSQLVYVHQRLANNERARLFAERATDALAAGPQGISDAGLTVPERRFAFTRLHEDLGRRFTVSVDGFSGSGAASATSTTGAARAFRSYGQAEADVRLGSPPIRNGSTLSAYARVFGDGGDANLPLPTANATMGAGVRWKPLGNRVLFVMAEAQMTPGTGDRDVLVRGSTSLFNGGTWSDDWHPSGRGWLARNLYLDAAYYAISQRFAVTGDYRMSYHRRLNGSQTVEPFARLQVNGFRSAAFERDIRVGIGARWNLWASERRYDAFRLKLSAGIEYQRAIATYLPVRNGVFVSFGVRR
jgi:adsorption protein A